MSPSRSPRRWRAVALAGLIGLGMGLGLAHAQEKDKDVLRPEVAKPLQAAQDLIKGGKAADALTRIREAEAVANRSPYEVFITNRMKGSAAMLLNDHAAALKAFEAVANAGRLSPADQLWVLQALAGVALRAGDATASANWARRYLQEGGPDSNVRLTLVQALYAANDFAGTAKEVLPLIQADELAGRAPKEEQLKLLGFCQLKLNDEVGYTQTLEKLVTHYPTPEYWSDLISHIQRKSTFADRLLLDAYRLMRRTGTLEDADEYLEMAQLALQAGLPGEAQSVVEQGYTQNILGKGADGERHQRLRTTVTKSAKDDKAQLSASETTARSLRDGAPLVALGMALISYGQPDKGLALMAEGLSKGVQKHPDDARLHAGIALLTAGRSAEAAAQFKAITATDGAADLARLWLLVR